MHTGKTEKCFKIVVQISPNKHVRPLGKKIQIIGMHYLKYFSLRFRLHISDDVYKLFEHIKTTPCNEQYCCQQELLDCLHLMLLEADLNLLVLWSGKLLMITTKLAVTKIKKEENHRGTCMICCAPRNLHNP